MTEIRPPKPPVVLFAGPADEREAWRAALEAAARRDDREIALHMAPDDIAPGRVDYLLFAPGGPVTDFAPYSGLKAILSLWAGVEAVLDRDPPRRVPLCRMVDDGLTLGMVDYVSGHVLRHHLDIDRYIGAGPGGAWARDFPPLARDRRVGVLGLGALGAACARALAGHGFRVAGWSRGEKALPGIACLHGTDGLDRLLESSEILVLLLPHTPETERLMDAERLGRMPPGAVLINAARGRLIDHEALLRALDDGRLRHATMDVFDEEPLPADHPYWHHARVTVTPHIASATRPGTAAEAILAQIARAERGEPLMHVVDYGRGY